MTMDSSRNTTELINKYYDEIHFLLQTKYQQKLLEFQEWFVESTEKIETERTMELNRLSENLRLAFLCHALSAQDISDIEEKIGTERTKEIVGLAQPPEVTP